MCMFSFISLPPPFFGIALLGFILSADLIMLGLFKSSATLYFHLGPQLILDGEFDCRGFISENYRLCWWLLRRTRDGTTSASLCYHLSVQISGLFISIHIVSTMNLRKRSHGALYNIVRISCRCALCISSTTIPSLQISICRYYSLLVCIPMCVLCSCMHVHTYLPVCMFKSGFHLQSSDWPWTWDLPPSALKKPWKIIDMFHHSCLF